MNTDGLASIVTGFVADWERNHPRATGVDSRGYEAHGRNAHHDSQGRFAPRDPDTPIDDLSAIAALAERTRQLATLVVPKAGPRRVEDVDEELLQVEGLISATVVTTATIRKIVRMTHQHTELRIADPIVAAARRPFAFYDGTLTVRPNPYADPATRATCCGSPGITGLF